jgi:hypothetical protein
MEFRQVGSISCHTSGQEDACKNDSRLMLRRICLVYHFQDKVISDWKVLMLRQGNAKPSTNSI